MKSIEVLKKCLLGKALRGDIVLVEYSSNYPVERLVWEDTVPLMKSSGELVVCDFFGIGETFFRKYVRRLPGREYSRFIELLRGIKIVKVGPGTATYGEVIEELVPTYDPHIFLRNYHSIMGKVSRMPQKPKYFVSFGLGHYIHFNPDEAVKSLLTAITNIPMEDLLSVHFINTDILDRKHLAIMEELATFVIRASEGGLSVIKDGGIGD